MKSTGEKKQPGNISLLASVLVLEVLISTALAGILLLVVRDYFTPGYVLARNNGANPVELPILSPSATICVDVTITNIPFPPLPAVTSMVRPSSTPLPTLTWTATPTSTDTLPPPPSLQPNNPTDSASISNITGHPQSLTLDCESRSAVDWAAYFGVSIGEFEFLYVLPTSDDPNLGFVGDPNGIPGLPPYSYGVHAAPVARLLRMYGLPAENVYGLTIDALKAEIAAGRPVMVWVIVGTIRGYAVEYTTSAGATIKVAPDEHTVIVIGYDPDGVTILDGAWVYWRDWSTFTDSFSVLGNMAIIAR